MCLRDAEASAAPAALSRSPWARLCVLGNRVLQAVICVCLPIPVCAVDWFGMERRKVWKVLECIVFTSGVSSVHMRKQAGKCKREKALLGRRESISTWV